MDGHESFVSSIAPFFFFLFFFFSFSRLQGSALCCGWIQVIPEAQTFFSFSPLQGYESNMSYAVDEYESSVSGSVPFCLVFLAFPLFKVMSLI